MPFLIYSFGKAHLSTFGVGIIFGLTVSYILKYTEDSRVVLPASFIPRDPHSHGENDFFRGPEHSFSWTDDDYHSHANRNHSLADKLYKEVRVLCWVMTNPSNIKSKARHVKATWGKRCNVLLFMSSETDKDLPAVGLHVDEGRNNLWAKTKAAFRHVYKYYFKKADWFMKVDDDTYLIPENLRYFLHDKSPSNPIYYGRKFKPLVTQGYMSGGAGYVLSKEALQKFIVKGLNRNICREDSNGSEDVEMGRCLEVAGVEAGDSRDELGRERFHPFIPEHHLIPNILPKNMWYWSYNFYPAKQGPECCSDYTISFHYIPPNMMYILEFFIYHLQPYGLHTPVPVIPPSSKRTTPGVTPDKGLLTLDSTENPNKLDSLISRAKSKQDSITGGGARNETANKDFRKRTISTSEPLTGA